jgi:hypothetical protein
LNFHVVGDMLAVLVCAFLCGGGLHMTLDSVRKGAHPALTTACIGFALIWLVVGTLILIAHSPWVNGS